MSHENLENAQLYIDCLVFWSELGPQKHDPENNQIFLALIQKTPKDF